MPSHPGIRDVDFFRGQQRVLEGVFPRAWLEAARNAAHPAALRWRLLQRLIEQRGTIYPEQAADLPLLIRTILDGVLIAEATVGDAINLVAGPLSAYGNVKVEEKIRSRVTSPDAFEDVMLELSFAAWHKMQTHYAVEPLEVEGADFKIRLPSGALLIPECKRIVSATKQRLTKEVRYANHQIKQVAGDYGVAVFDVSIAAQAAPAEFGDEAPPVIQHLESLILPALSGSFNRSVAEVLLLWDEYLVYKETIVAFNRRYRRIPHRPDPGVRPIPPDVTVYTGLASAFRIERRPEGTTPEIRHELRNRDDDTERAEICIPNASDLGSGTFTTAFKPNVLHLRKPIASIIRNEDALQVSATINPSGDVTVLIGQAKPVSGATFLLTAAVDPTLPHTLKVEFRGWRIAAVSLDDSALLMKQGIEKPTANDPPPP
jgi:hypothetical protein